MCRCNCAGKGKHGIKACDVRAGCLPKFSADSHIQSNNNNTHGQIEIHDQFSGTYLQKVPSIHGEQEMELGCEAKNPVSSREKGNSVLVHFNYKNATTLPFLYCFEKSRTDLLEPTPKHTWRTTCAVDFSGVVVEGPRWAGTA